MGKVFYHITQPMWVYGVCVHGLLEQWRQPSQLDPPTRKYFSPEVEEEAKEPVSSVKPLSSSLSAYNIYHKVLSPTPTTNINFRPIVIY